MFLMLLLNFFRVLIKTLKSLNALKESSFRNVSNLSDISPIITGTKSFCKEFTLSRNSQVLNVANFQ